jgi:hypothetical protein
MVVYRFTVSSDGFSFNCRPHEQDIKEAEGLRQVPCCGREDVLLRYWNRPMMVWLLAWSPPFKLFSYTSMETYSNLQQLRLSIGEGDDESSFRIM